MTEAWTTLLDRIESALQRAPVMCASPATWVADEGEPAMEALRELRKLTAVGQTSSMDEITEAQLPPCPWCSSRLTLRDHTAVCPVHGDLEETPEELLEMYQDYLSRPDA